MSLRTMDSSFRAQATLIVFVAAQTQVDSARAFSVLFIKRLWKKLEGIGGEKDMSSCLAGNIESQYV